MPPSGVTPGMARAAVARGSLSGIVPLDQSAYTLPASLLGLYLRRLGVDASKLAVDLTTLTMLQVAHVDRIAYENVSLHQGPGGTPSEQPELSPLASVMRVAAGGRGGYCFLLVDAYAALLCSLGFCVSLHVGGCGEDPLPDAKRGNHVVMLVHLPGHPTPYISDVGLGDGPSAPFPLRPHTWHEHGYTFALRDHGGGEWRFVHDAVGSFDGFTVSLATSPHLPYISIYLPRSLCISLHLQGEPRHVVRGRARVPLVPQLLLAG